MLRNEVDPWQINEVDFPGDGDMRDRIEFLLGYAILAPSVHNTQPWEFEIGDGGVRVYASTERRLGPGDPTGRELHLSVGAAVANFEVAANHFGLKVDTSWGSPDGALARLAVTEGARASELNERLFSCITQRRSNRSEFTGHAPRPDQLKALVALGSAESTVFVVTDQAKLDQIGELGRRGLRLALSSKPFVRELTDLMRPAWGSARTGMPSSTLGIPAIIFPWVRRQMRRSPDLDRESERERQLLSGSPLILVVTGKGDIGKFWLEAGRVMQRVLLLLTEMGLQTALHAGAVEAGDNYMELQKVLGTNERPLALIRAGHGDERPHSPRLSVSEVLRGS